MRNIQIEVVKIVTTFKMEKIQFRNILRKKQNKEFSKCCIYTFTTKNNIFLKNQLFK